MQSDTEFVDALVKVAGQHSAELEKLPQREWGNYIRKIMKRSKVVYAIWYTNDERHCYCIKGMDTPDGKVTEATAFLVNSAADAEGMKRDWGDGPTRASAMN